MIDIHTHLLPGVDDGAESVEEALDMARAAVADGTRQLFVTPHTAADAYRGDRADAEARVTSLREAIRAAGIPLELLWGSEALLTPDLPEQLNRKRAFTLNGSRYLLVELPSWAFPPYADEVLFALQLKGLVPIIAHPERHPAIQRDHSILFRLVRRGLLTQMTAGSLLGIFGSAARRVAEAMLVHRLAHVIASDAHWFDTRRPVLSRAVQQAARWVGQEQAMAMVTSVPQKIVHNAEIEVPPPDPAGAKGLRGLLEAIRR